MRSIAEANVASNGDRGAWGMPILNILAAHNTDIIHFTGEHIFLLKVPRVVSREWPEGK